MRVVFESGDEKAQVLTFLKLVKQHFKSYPQEVEKVTLLVENTPVKKIP